MIRYLSNRQLSFSEFILPFSGALNGENRWIKLANLLPCQKSGKTIRRGIRQKLQHLRRNIEIINKLSESAAARKLLQRCDKALIKTIGKVYAQQKEMYDEKKRRIVGWSMSQRMTRDLVLNALKSALGRRKIPSWLDPFPCSLNKGWFGIAV